MTVIPTLTLPSGATMPTFGLGTWRMGESATKRGDEVKALAHGLSLGVTLIDTAEMYGDGEAETIVADAVGNKRDEVFIVSKVLPSNSSKRGTIAACERSLKRLRTGRIDLYLLHWRGSPSLRETIEAGPGRCRSWPIRRSSRVACCPTPRWARSRDGTRPRPLRSR